MKDKLAGINSVMEALKNKRKIYRILIQEGHRGGRLRDLLEEAKRRGIYVKFVSKTELDQNYKDGNHQGVIAQVDTFDYADTEDILRRAAEKNEPPFILILDGIEDPQNFGSIIRTAECAGVHGVIIPKHGSCPVTETVRKVSAGAAEHMLIALETNLSQVIDYLKKQMVWIIGADMEAKKNYFQAEWPEAVALVVGNEGKGIRNLVKKNCDFCVNIPMKGNITSLNVSVAAGLVMYEIRRSRDIRTKE
ncbi:MAG: 23S rRNA (guanosine(2251)-2'-O)-methyltransferase RlmB [Syntrophomonadaceae bacterium]|jgi:23S rRNA (guanosine2251-2'-O)-methyltransferase|nr:23S rRNA (guanosine(2251)-2'-O)-methyltransferase RlmB [Syntrophomonadaceae bacterium]